MGSPQLSYENRVQLLGIKCLQKRREYSALKLTQKIGLKFPDIPYKWSEYLIFYKTSRNDIQIKTHLYRIHIIDKFYLNFV